MTAHPYIMTRNLPFAGDGTERVFNLTQFCRDMAAELGGEASTPDSDTPESRAHEAVRGFVVEGVPFYVSPGYGAKFGHVTISAHLPNRLNPWRDTVRAESWPSIGADASRPSARIAQDIMRKLMTDARDRIAKVEARKAQYDATQKELRANMAEVRRIRPAARIDEPQSETSTSVTFYDSEKQISGRIDSRGVYVERCTIPLSKAADFFALL